MTLRLFAPDCTRFSAKAGHKGVLMVAVALNFNLFENMCLCEYIVYVV